jgi:hypothetical protein
MNKWRVEIWEGLDAGLMLFFLYREGEVVYSRHERATSVGMSRTTAGVVGCQDGWLYAKQLSRVELEHGDDWTRGRCEEAAPAGAAQ